MADTTGDSGTEGEIVGDFRIGKRLGGGSFGEVRLGQNVYSKEPVAIKLESIEMEQPALHLEWKFLKVCAGGEGIPEVYHYQKYGKYTIMVMQILGENLEQLFNICDREFSLKTIAMIGAQIFRRLQYLHNNGILYRDIKPENFMIGLPEKKEQGLIYIIDFGLSKQYIRSDTQAHISYHSKASSGMVGTARYMSVAANEGATQSRRDDLESALHMILYLMKSKLPWMGLKVKHRHQQHAAIAKVKEMSVETVCEGLPTEFSEILQYIRGLHFDEDPDYNFIIDKFTGILTRNGWKEDGQFDWQYYKEIDYANRSCFPVCYCFRKCAALRLKCRKKIPKGY